MPVENLELSIQQFVRLASVGFEAAGVLAIVIGAIWVTVTYLRERWSDPSMAYKKFRAGLGRTILLGLELLVAADIIHTVGIEASYTTLGALALVIFIRTFLSTALEVEITGRWPWQGENEKATGKSSVRVP